MPEPVPLRGMAESALLLLYTYVDDMLERRGPHREEHLSRIAAERDAGHLVVAGAIGDPPTGAAIGFRGVDRAHVERFVAGDPYVRAGLVREWRVEPWALV
ncbi:MAG TPA: YciI family protein [Solirubrobacteraceae bacterium]|nr:YciI family protein [Solirubrobacteraceae bacterium]